MPDIILEGFSQLVMVTIIFNTLSFSVVYYSSNVSELLVSFKSALFMQNFVLNSCSV